MPRLLAQSLPAVHARLQPSPYTAEARSVTGGASPGWVYAEGSAILVGSRGMEGFWLFVEEGDDEAGPLAATLRRFAEGAGRCAMDEAGFDFLEVSAASLDCQQALRDAFSPWQLEVSASRILRSGRAGPPAVSRELPPVAPVVDLLASGHVGGVDLAARIERFWGSVQRFVAAGGMGYCTLHDGRATSVCMSAFVDGKVHCVDMETHESFRRRGHGTAAALAFQQACQDHGLTMHWSCMERNVASYGLARRIGLAEAGCYQTCGFVYANDADLPWPSRP